MLLWAVLVIRRLQRRFILRLAEKRCLLLIYMQIDLQVKCCKPHDIATHGVFEKKKLHKLGGEGKQREEEGV